MDFSKTTLQDLDNKKSSKFFSESNFCIDNNSCSNQTKHENTRHKCDLGNANIQNSMHSKYKQLDPINMHTTNDITPVQNIGLLSNVNDLTGCPDKSVSFQYQDSQFVEASTLEIKLNVPLSICSNISKKRKIAEELNNDILTTSDPSNKNVEQLIDLQKELTKVVDEEETIEKIAEMIATSSKDPMKSITKNKKRLSMNSEHENTCNIDIETDHGNVNDTDKIKYLNGTTNKNSKRFFDTQKVITTAKIDIIYETTEDNLLNKSRFEEFLEAVRNKLLHRTQWTTISNFISYMGMCNDVTSTMV